LTFKTGIPAPAHLAKIQHRRQNRTQLKKEKNTHRGGKTRTFTTIIVIREAMSVFSCRERMTLSCCCGVSQHTHSTSICDQSLRHRSCAKAEVVDSSAPPTHVNRKQARRARNNLTRRWHTPRAFNYIHMAKRLCVTQHLRYNRNFICQ
jgi:hypothetical protein